MIFKFDEYEIKPEIRNRQAKKSLHTENELEVLEISFRTDEEFENPEILHTDNKKWKIVSSSSSYLQGSSITTYNWEIEEIEELTLKKLLINDLECVPYSYKEEIEVSYGNAIHINAL